jgi:hypothetical protein
MADFAAVVVHWTIEVHLTTWLGELLPADTLDHRDVGGRTMSGTSAEIELVVRDGLDGFLHGTLVKSPLPLASCVRIVVASNFQ